jgi:hypothetical protein
MEQRSGNRDQVQQSVHQLINGYAIGLGIVGKKHAVTHDVMNHGVDIVG